MTARRRHNDPRIRGDINAILNGLVRLGVISSFETSFSADDGVRRAKGLASPEPVTITVLTGTATNPDAAEIAVHEALERFSDQVEVILKAG